MEFPNLSNADRICIDVETRDDDLLTQGAGVRRDGYMVGIAVGVDNKQWYFPIDHPDKQYNLDKGQVLSWCRDTFKRPEQTKVFAHAIYDLDYLAQAGVEVQGPIFDVQIAEPLLDENAKSYSLENLAQKYLKETKSDDELYEYASMKFGGKPTRKAQGGNIWRCPVPMVEHYAKGDVDLPLRIMNIQEKQLTEDSLDEIFSIESRLIPLLLAMRQRGVRIDLEKAEKLHFDLSTKIYEAQASMHKVYPAEFNINSNIEIASAFDKLGITYSLTDLGAPSFTKGFLEMVEHPIGKGIVAIRKNTKLRDVFIKSYVLDHNINGKIHCDFNQLRSDEYGTVTGRFSSSNPNLQNIPSRDAELAPLVRGMFIPDEGCFWHKHDYSQIEYRIAAHYARGESGKNVRDAMNGNHAIDFHQMTADMANISRQHAKTINFGMLFGMGIGKMSKELGMSEREAKPLFEQYKSTTSFMTQMLKEADAVAQEQGFVRTIMGRRRRFDLWEPMRFTKGKFPKPYEEARHEYGPNIKRGYTYTRALNAVIQGSAADMLKKALVDIWESGVCSVLGPPLLTVHDELNYSVPNSQEGKDAINTAHRLMENAIPLRVPVLVDVKSGTSWGSCK